MEKTEGDFTSYDNSNLQIDNLRFSLIYKIVRLFIFQPKLTSAIIWPTYHQLFCKRFFATYVVIFFYKIPVRVSRPYTYPINFCPILAPQIRRGA